MPASRSWLPQFLLLALIWGGSFLFIKVSLDDLAPLHVAFLRCVIGAGALFAALALRRERVPRDPKLWGHLTVAALLLNAVPFTLFAYGEERAREILGTNRHNTVYYPSLTIKGAIQAIRVARPIAPDFR